MTKLQIHRRLLSGPPGWMECEVVLSDRSVTIGPFSGAITDGFDELVRAALAITVGAFQASCAFDGEPEPRWHWKLERASTGADLHVLVTEADCMDKKVAVLLKMTVPADEFARAVLDAAREAPHAGGPGDQQDFRDPLRGRAVRALKAALASEP